MGVILLLPHPCCNALTKPFRGFFAFPHHHFQVTFQYLKMPDQPITMTDRELELIKLYANAQGITVEEATNQLGSDALAKRYKRVINRPQATVYDIRGRR